MEKHTSIIKKGLYTENEIIIKAIEQLIDESQKHINDINEKINEKEI